MATAPSGPKELPAPAQLMRMLAGKWITVAIGTAAELGIADLLANGDKSVEELAAAISCHTPSVYRLLRALASLGVFAETETGEFTLTPMARCLQSDVAGSIRNLARLSIIPGGWNGLGQLVHCVRTGETAFVKTFGLTNPFDYFKSHPEERAIFNAAMTDLALMSAPALAQAYDFGRFRRLVDVGGGQGSMLATILQRYPEVTAVLFDLPTVVERARPLLASSGVADRCEVVSGDFFQSVPHGGDGYIMRHIIHDWDDERSIHILRNTRHAIDPLGRLLLVDSVIASGNSPSPAKLVDLEMMALTGGCERTEAEFRELLAATGFRLLSVHPGTGGDGDQIIEAAPVLA